MGREARRPRLSRRQPRLDPSTADAPCREAPGRCVLGERDAASGRRRRARTARGSDRRGTAGVVRRHPRRPRRPVRTTSARSSSGGCSNGPAANCRRSSPALARLHAIDVQRISIRNQRSRWGACSPTGTITLNWRLIQTPPFVREYVLLHELMHRRELNHSRRFWRLVAACCPRHQEARRWLRTEGKSLWSDCDSR